MPSSEFPEETAALLPGLATSPPRALSQLVALVTGQVPGCSGATAALLRDGPPPVLGASHPDLSELAELEYKAGRGPIFAALNENHPVSCPRPPRRGAPRRIRGAAGLARGVRCTLTLVHRSGPAVVALTLYGARPRLLSADDVPAARLLAAFGGALLGSAAEYQQAQRTVLQLREAAQARAVVDQARGC